MRIVLLLFLYLVGPCSAANDEENIQASPDNDDGKDYGIDSSRHPSDQKQSSPSRGQTTGNQAYDDGYTGNKENHYSNPETDDSFNGRNKGYPSKMKDYNEAGISPAEDKGSTDRSSLTQPSTTFGGQSVSTDQYQTNGDTGQQSKTEHNTMDNHKPGGDSQGFGSDEKRQEPNEALRGGGDKTANNDSPLDFSKVPLPSALGDSVHIEDDNTDIDEFDFQIDELDEEDNSEIHSNEIPPTDWISILKNYIEVIQKERSSKRNQFNIKTSNDLIQLEEELVRRNLQDFTEDTEEEIQKKIHCSKLEFNVLSFIKRLPIDIQRCVFDVNHDGIPDFEMVDITSGLSVQKTPSGHSESAPITGGNNLETTTYVTSDNHLETTAPLPSENHIDTNQEINQSSIPYQSEGSNQEHNNNYESNSNKYETPARN